MALRLGGWRILVPAARTNISSCRIGAYNDTCHRHLRAALSPYATASLRCQNTVSVYRTRHLWRTDRLGTLCFRYATCAIPTIPPTVPASGLCRAYHTLLYYSCLTTL